MAYSIWIEHEEFQDFNLEDEDNCNVIVTFDDGHAQGYDVWTLKYFTERLTGLIVEAEINGFTVGPDIIVTDLSREHITKVLAQIIPRS